MSQLQQLDWYRTKDSPPPWSKNQFHFVAKWITASNTSRGLEIEATPRSSITALKKKKKKSKMVQWLQIKIQYTRKFNKRKNFRMTDQCLDTLREHKWIWHQRLVLCNVSSALHSAVRLDCGATRFHYLFSWVLSQAACFDPPIFYVQHFKMWNSKHPVLHKYDV